MSCLLLFLKQPAGGESLEGVSTGAEAGALVEAGTLLLREMVQKDKVARKHSFGSLLGPSNREIVTCRRKNKQE